MTKQQQLEALLEQIVKLKAEAKEIEEQIAREPWRPKYREKYYIADPSTLCYYGTSCWCDDVADNHRIKSGNCYLTAKEAAEAGKRIYYRHWAESLSDVTEEMWRDTACPKYFTGWNYEDKTMQFEFDEWWRGSGIPYFSTKEILQTAITTIGEDNWIKYVLGVQI